MLRPLLLLAGLGASALAAAELSTDYTAERVLVLDVTTRLSMETVESRFIRDGEETQGRGGGGAGSTEERRLVLRDRVLAHEDARPTKVRRTFETAEGERSMSFGEEDRETTLESPFEGLVLELTRVDDEIDVEVVEGDAPDSEHLEGQTLTLFLDALLPADDAEAGDTWALDSEAVKRALLLDVQPHLFPPPAPDEDEGGRGRGRGGFRGASGGAIGLLTGADFEGEAELVATDEAGAEGPVARIRFEARAEGEIAALGDPNSDGETTYSVELEGELVFSLATRRPVALEVSGEVGRVSERTFERGESTMSMYREEAGTFELTVAISQEDVDEDE